MNYNVIEAVKRHFRVSNGYEARAYLKRALNDNDQDYTQALRLYIGRFEKSGRGGFDEEILVKILASKFVDFLEASFNHTAANNPLASRILGGAYTHIDFPVVAKSLADDVLDLIAKADDAPRASGSELVDEVEAKGRSATTADDYNEIARKADAAIIGILDADSASEWLSLVDPLPEDRRRRLICSAEDAIERREKHTSSAAPYADIRRGYLQALGTLRHARKDVGDAYRRRSLEVQAKREAREALGLAKAIQADILGAMARSTVEKEDDKVKTPPSNIDGLPIDP